MISTYAAMTSKSCCSLGCDDHGRLAPIDLPATPLIGVEKTVRQTSALSYRRDLNRGFLLILAALLDQHSSFMGNVHLESALHMTHPYPSPLGCCLFKDTFVKLVGTSTLDSGLDVRGRDDYLKRGRDLVFQMRKTPDEILCGQSRIEALLC